MDIVKAVQLAKAGDDAGFTYLYEHTYQSKYYLALKYVKDEETAKDVLQESYLKAFSKIDTLDYPEKFSAWLGMIVANTAQNVLKKKNPTLFADVAPGYEVDFETETVDENTFNRPESACTQKETVELVHELLGTLSEPQRICILMYHIEGYSISEIAETLGCAENTVKSRLVYGRKAIKAKAEELQKKGHQLYVVAPGAILIYFLTREEEFLAADGTLDVVKNNMPNPADAKKDGSTLESDLLETQTKVGGKELVKKGFLATTAGKVTVAVAALLVTGTVAAGAMGLFGGDVDVTDGKDSQMEESQETETEETESQLPTSFEVTDEMYPELLAGNITKEQLEFIVGLGPKEITDGTYNMRNLEYIVMKWKEQYDLGQSSYVTSSGYTSDYMYYAYDLKEVNRFLSVLGVELTETHNSQLGLYTAQVIGDEFCISTSIPDATFKAETTILRAYVDGDTMTIEYDVEFTLFESDGYENVQEYHLIANLEKGEDGLFRMVTLGARE